ncbi:MAG: radical SAM protein [Promethearchaeota archaeon]
MIYGPFPSRRLGLSLGVDILPRIKTCTFNCPYCEIGPTIGKGYASIEKEIKLNDNYYAEMYENLKTVLKNIPFLNSITVGYNGEPTLAVNLDEIIGKIREIKNEINQKVPISIFTNSSTILNQKVCKHLSLVDKVVAKLDAATTGVFQIMNNPHPSVPPIEEIINGLKEYKENYPNNKLILQTMLIDGKYANIGSKNIKALSEAYKKICPDKIQLYTISRAPADRSVKVVSDKKLREIKERIISFIGKGFTQKIWVFPFR